MKRTIVDQIEVTSQGHINVRMKKQVVDGDNTYDVGFHRTSIQCGGDCEMQMSAVNAHLGSMGEGLVSEEDIASVLSHAKLAFTPERIAVFQKLLIGQFNGK